MTCEMNSLTAELPAKRKATEDLELGDIKKFRDTTIPIDSDISMLQTYHEKFNNKSFMNREISYMTFLPQGVTENNLQEVLDRNRVGTGADKILHDTGHKMLLKPLNDIREIYENEGYHNTWQLIRHNIGVFHALLKVWKFHEKVWGNCKFEQAYDMWQALLRLYKLVDFLRPVTHGKMQTDMVDIMLYLNERLIERLTYIREYPHHITRYLDIAEMDAHTDIGPYMVSRHNDIPNSSVIE